jgi:hypothetical protein
MLPSALSVTRRTAGPQPEKKIRLALSLIEAARAAAGGRYPVDPRRAESDATVRRVWNTLRERSRP